MTYHITVKVQCECDALNMFDTLDFDLPIQEDIKDVIAYLFYKKYDKVYDEFSWYPEDGAKEFVKSIEDSWNDNTFDTFTLYHDTKFLDFLKWRYDDPEISEDVMEDLLEEFREDIEDELCGMSKVDLKYLLETEGSEFDYWVGNAKGIFDLEDYIDDHSWLWEDEEDDE